MIVTYRKYLEPAYGDPLPGTRIQAPEVCDMDDFGKWRKMHHLQTIADLTNDIKSCYCYRPIMEIETTDTALERDGARIPLRVYHPEGEGPFPIMLFIHGGGWRMNNLDIYDYVPRYFAKYGHVAVVSVDYRLAPEHKFPTGLEDAYAALEWAVANADSYRGDIGSVSVCGDSAGGNFSAALCLMSRDRRGPAIHKQILLYPATTFLLNERTESEKHYGNGDHFLIINSELGMVNDYFADQKDAENPYASPLNAESLKGLPPACFISAECDPLLDQALMYAARLEDEGVEVEYHLYTGVLHAFINQTYQKTFEAMDDIIAAVPGSYR